MAGPHSPDPLAHRVHRTLLAGVVAGAVLMALGLAVALVRGQPGPAPTPGSVRAMFGRAMAGDAAALVDLGLLVLILTPAVRVLVLVIGWAAAGDRLFAAVAGVVLALLGLSMWLGLV